MFCLERENQMGFHFQKRYVTKFNLPVKDNNSTYTTQQLGDFRECSETESLDPKIESGDLYFKQLGGETQEYESD